VSEPTVWRIRGVLLPTEEVRDLFVVGDRVTFEPVAGAQTLTDRGWIIPGLVDAHCHIGLRNGGTPVRDAAGAKELATIDRDTGVLGIRDAGSPVPYPQLDDDPDMPRLVRAGRHLAPPGRYMPGVSHECTADELPAAVVAQAHAGNGWVKLVADFFDADQDGIAGNWDPDTLAAAVTAAHRAGARVAAHTLGPAVVQTLVAAGVDSIEHGTGLTIDLLDAMAGRRIALVPTMLAVNSTRLVAAIAEPRFPAYAGALRRALDHFPDVIAAAREAGVPIYVGTDAGSEVRHGRIADEMLALHQRAGVPAGDVVAAASWRAREWLGLGQLVEGGPADLVVYEHDPRRDLTTIRRPDRVLLRGRVLR
jgi:imidazolonepropionase-like amidohydrolase